MDRILLKIIVLGDCGVGKTSLMNQFIDESFRKQYTPTIETEFCTREIELDNKLVTIQIWDSGDEIPQQIYRGVDGCILVYDITDKESFENLENRMGHFLEQANPKKPDTFPFVVVGNKLDLEKRRQVPNLTVRKWCRAGENWIQEFEVSSQDNVDFPFHCIAKNILTRDGYCQTSSTEPPNQQDDTSPDLFGQPNSGDSQHVDGESKDEEHTAKTEDLQYFLEKRKNLRAQRNQLEIQLSGLQTEKQELIEQSYSLDQRKMDAVVAEQYVLAGEFKKELNCLNSTLQTKSGKVDKCRAQVEQIDENLVAVEGKISKFVVKMSNEKSPKFNPYMWLGNTKQLEEEITKHLTQISDLQKRHDMLQQNVNIFESRKVGLRDQAKGLSTRKDEAVKAEDFVLAENLKKDLGAMEATIETKDSELRECRLEIKKIEEEITILQTKLSDLKIQTQARTQARRHTSLIDFSQDRRNCSCREEGCCIL